MYYEMSVRVDHYYLLEPPTEASAAAVSCRPGATTRFRLRRLPGTGTVIPRPPTVVVTVYAVIIYDII